MNAENPTPQRKWYDNICTSSSMLLNVLKGYPVRFRHGFTVLHQVLLSFTATRIQKMVPYREHVVLVLISGFL